MNHLGRTLKERFEEKVRPELATGCLLWTAVDNGENGYGQIWVNGRMRYAHRTAWSMTHGEIPPGMKVLHSCDTPACVNVAHLFLGTQADNLADMRRKGRARNQWPRREG